MEREDIKVHWQNWAREYKEGLRATTKTPSIKALEIDALSRSFGKIIENRALKILEVGCGNGHNCFALAERFPKCEFTGVDYVHEMIENAQKIRSKNSSYDHISFRTGDILELDQHPELDEQYDIVFTDRCIINLNSDSLQQRAVDQLTKKVNARGFFVMIENSQATHHEQNDLREAVGLPPRPVAEFNHFINEEKLLPCIPGNFTLIEIDNFASLHDILLYVLIPSINRGKIDYDHPLMASATRMLLEISDTKSNSFGNFGQNRLYVFGRDD